jgi:tRNA nucleotidyltransferase (CCA-adding enzyme)
MVGREGGSGGGRRRYAVEVTTFRGEGAYSDGRRPDSVTFGVPLREDLARRDFVINAMAYDPIARRVIDPFGGRQDLAARRVRAVGDARERFTEDGLRVMRAVRFAAALEFALDPDTEAAIAPTLPILAKVSWERIRDELVKTLASARPSRGLAIARRTGILAQIIPELGFRPSGDDGDDGGGGDDDDDDVRWRLALARVDAAPPGDGAVLRLGALLLDVAGDAPDRAEPVCRRLRLSNAERERVVRVVRFGRAWASPPATDAALRALLGQITRRAAPDVAAVWRACAAAVRDTDSESVRQPDTAAPATLETIAALADRADAILAAKDALATGDLAIAGGDIMRELGLPPGPQIGKVLATLLNRVYNDPTLNERDKLLALMLTSQS